MTTFLLISLLVLDFGLIVCIAILNRRQEAHLSLVEDMTEERRLLNELRASVQEELQAGQYKIKESVDKVAQLATEAEIEVKSGGQTIAEEVEKIMVTLTSQFENPLRELNRKQAAIENLLRKLDKEKSLLSKLTQRAEKVCHFLGNKIPYDELLEEIEDKKYADARELLARGETPKFIAEELGMPESEVRLVAGFSST